MRKFILSVLLIFLGFGAAWAAGSFTVRDNLSWFVTKSPQTGICYEVAEYTRKPFGYHGFGFMGMSPVPCTDVGLE